MPTPATPIDSADRSWLGDASRANGPHGHPDRQRVAIRLCEQPEAAVLLLRLQAGLDPEAFLDGLAAPLQLAGLHLQRALEWSELQHSHQQLERSENLQRALFAISDLAGSDLDMPAMLRGIHAIVGTLMYAENFFIVLLRSPGATRFASCISSTCEDPKPPGNGRDMPLSAIEYTLTWYVLSDGKARMGDAEELRNQVRGPVALMVRTATTGSACRCCATATLLARWSCRAISRTSVSPRRSGPAGVCRQPYPHRAGAQAEQGRPRAARAVCARRSWPRPIGACSWKSSSGSAPSTCRRRCSRSPSWPRPISIRRSSTGACMRWSASC